MRICLAVSVCSTISYSMPSKDNERAACRFDHRGPQARIPRHPLILRARGPIEYLNKKIACSRHADGSEQIHPEEAFT